MNEAQLIRGWSELWRPPERLPMSEWAEKNFVLSPEYSARTGELVLYGWQREPFDAVSDPTVETIVLMCGIQMLKTLLMQVSIAYFISQAPGPILFSAYKDGDVRKFSKERIAPMLRDCPTLAGKMTDSRRDADNTIDYKRFPGGTLTMVGSLSTANFSGRTIRYYLGDEVDKYPGSVGGQGDPIWLARGRTTNFGTQKKIILACSPTTKGQSRIAKAFEASDQRKPWVPCPRCGEYQILKWPQVTDVAGRNWSTLTIGERVAGARYECINRECRYRWNDLERWAACEKAQYRAERPFYGTAGFWISHLYSPWKKLGDIVTQHAEAGKDPDQLRVWVNDVLVELWEDRGEAPDDEMIWRRHENYAIGTVPAGGLFLTAFVDVQDESLYIEVKAWGRRKENWSVHYERIQCETKDGHPIKTSSREPWAALEELLVRDWPHESGVTMPIMAMGIDSGFRPDPIYDFARRYPQPFHSDATGAKIYAVRTVVPTKGNDDAFKLISSVSREDAARKRHGLRIWHIGTHRAKQEFYDCLRQEPGADGAFPPGYCHYPYPEREFYRQICAESRVVRQDGKVEWVRDAAIRNEPLDTHVGNRAVASLCGIDAWQEAQWRELERRAAPEAITEAPKVPMDHLAAESQQPEPPSRWRTRFRMEI